MLMRYSLKQMLRTPVKTALFLILLILAALLASLGGNLWYMSTTNIERLEKTFTTIGTVEQRKTSVEQRKEWDAEEQDYIFYNVPQCDELLPVSVLDFEGADYIQKPQRRPYYEAYLPEYEIWPSNGEYGAVWRSPVIVDASPLEDCVPNHPVEMRVNEVIYSSLPFNSSILNFCSHYSEQPDKLYAGKRYIMALIDRPGHKEGSFEYMEAASLAGLQYNSNGEIIPNKTPDISYEEITEDFYEEGGGWEQWQELINLLKRMHDTVPVTPTHSTNLLMSFYSGDSYVVEGKDISPQEYEQGEKVCLIPRDFAKNNNISIGDTINLPLCTANYRFTAGYAGGYFNMFLNAEGKVYPVFSQHDYRVTGIYMNAPGASVAPKYQMGNCEIIVPWDSIEESDENNIVAYGPMMGYNTTFQIPNGTVEKYMAAWEKQGIDGLDITFYDKGYTQMKDGLDQMKELAVILFFAGSVTALLILLFFCHLFISRQKKRTAIERSLGMSRKMCKASLLRGIMVIVVAGSIAGSILGYALVRKTVEQIGGEDYYDVRYSVSALSTEGSEDEVHIDYFGSSQWIAVFTGLGITLLAYFLSTVEVKKNLRYEPLKLLGKRQD